jgi:hypothetical protein
MKEIAKRALGIRNPDYFVIGVFEDQGSDDLNRKAIEHGIGEFLKRAQPFFSNEVLCSRWLALIERARVAGRTRNWNHAWQALTEASMWLNRAIISESLRLVRFRLLFVPLFWFIILFSIQSLLGKPQNAHNISDWINMGYFSYLWFGMFGGTTILLWGIVKHSSEMNFDSSYLIWYLLKPALGAMMGAIAVLMTKGGFLALKGDPINIPNIALLLISFVGGFSERFFLRLVDRVISSFFEGENTGRSQLEIAREGTSGVDLPHRDSKG